MTNNKSCDFGGLRLTLDIANLHIENHRQGTKYSSDINLRRLMPRIDFYRESYPVRKWLRRGSLTAMAMLFVAIWLADKESGGFLLLSFGFVIAFIACLGSFATINNTCSTKTQANWILTDYLSGENYAIPAMGKLSGEREAFLAELEEALKKYSQFEIYAANISCMWDPAAFDQLYRLYRNGVITADEFAALKKARLDSITVPPRS